MWFFVHSFSSVKRHSSLKERQQITVVSPPRSTLTRILEIYFLIKAME